MAQLKDTVIEGVLKIQGKDSEGKALILPEESEIYIGNEPFKGGVSSEEIQQMGFITNNKIGGEELGLVKNGGNVTINPDGSMTAPAGGKEYGVGGNELGLVKNGGNVTINEDGTMTAPTNGGEVETFIQPDWNATEANKGAIKNKPAIFKGTGADSVQRHNCSAYGDYSSANGITSAAGCLGWYVWAIDTFNKKIYLTKKHKGKSAFTTTGFETDSEYIDTTFASPAYAIGNAFCMGNKNWYGNCGTISAVNNNVITYAGTLPFETIETSVTTFGVPTSPKIGNIVIQGKAAIAEGYNVSAVGTYAIARGYETMAIGWASVAEGNGCKAIGDASHAGGYLTNAMGLCSISDGYSSNAKGAYSYAGGYVSKANKTCSYAHGYYTVANQNYQVAMGKYNKIDNDNLYAYILGNGVGSADTQRANIYTVDWNGNGSFKGSVKSNGADYAEYFEWQDGNPNGEDRVGLLVTLDGDKIRLANSNDEIIGITSGTVAVLGDNYEWEWNGKYLTDDFGRLLYEEVEEFEDIITGFDMETDTPIIETVSTGMVKRPILNPEYDPTKQYVNRAHRPEWEAVGMVGKLYVNDDGTCIPNFYVTVGENGVATLSLDKTNMRVLSRVNDNVIRVLLK